MSIPGSNSDASSSEELMPTAGLQNNGNFCYLNSSIQCLRVLPPIIEFFRESDKRANVLIDFMKLFNALNVRNLEMNKKIFKTIAYYLDIHYKNTPSENDQDTNTYINPDEGKGIMALEAIYGKNPPSEIVTCSDDKVREIINGINNIKTKRNLSRQETYDIIRKLALHLDKVYVYVSLYGLLINMEKSSIGQASMIINPVELIATLNIATKDSIEYAHLCNGQQNDTSELTVVLMDFLHDSQSFPVNLRYSPEILAMSEDDIGQLSINERISVGIMRKIHSMYSNEYTSLVNGVFFFSLKILQCGNEKCATKAMSYDTDNILQVPIPTDDIDSELSKNKHNALTNIDNGKDMRIGEGPEFRNWGIDLRRIRANNQKIGNYCGMVSRRQLEMKADPVSIYDCIDNYFKKEIVDEYRCDKCKSANAKTTMCRALVNLPTVLIISLKRFRTIDNYGRREKVHRRVTYPIILDVSKYCVTNVNNGAYKLMAVNIHSGSVDGGHYKAMTYNAMQDQWYMFNDTNVTKLNVSDVLNNDNAYILYYSKL